MSVVKWIRKKSRLSQLIEQPGGMTMRRALEQAGDNVASLREECLAAVVEAVTALERLMDEPAADEGAWLDEVYRLSANVLDVIGPFEMDDIASAAFSLCDLADRLRASGKCRRDWVMVHVQALRLLLQLPADAAEGRREVLAGLERVTARAPRPSPP